MKIHVLISYCITVPLVNFAKHFTSVELGMQRLTASRPGRARTAPVIHESIREKITKIDFSD